MRYLALLLLLSGSCLWAADASAPAATPPAQAATQPPAAAEGQTQPAQAGATKAEDVPAQPGEQSAAGKTTQKSEKKSAAKTDKKTSAEDKAKKKPEPVAKASENETTTEKPAAVKAADAVPQWAVNYPESLKRYYGRFREFDEQDAQAMPEEGGAVFFGSSSITKWTQIPQDFAQIRAMNRGFGGSRTSDWLPLFDRYVVRYNPAYVVFYCGENDIAGGAEPEEVAENLRRIFWAIHLALPEAKLYYISLKPAPSREKFWPQMQKGNELCRRFCADKDWATFVDITGPMLGADGKPRPEIFLKDRLHMNRSGYEEIWIPALRKAMNLPEASPVSLKTTAENRNWKFAK